MDRIASLDNTLMALPLFIFDGPWEALAPVCSSSPFDLALPEPIEPSGL
jgi:hypothetical protein